MRFVLGGGGGRNPIDGGTFTIWYFIRGKEIHGGGGEEEIPCDTGFALFWQHDVSPTKTSIPCNYNQPYSEWLTQCLTTG